MLHEFSLIVYPFVEGKTAYEVVLSERQWADFGAALKRIHTTSIPPALSAQMQKESYAPEWRETCRRFVEWLDAETSDDPVAVELAAFLRSKRAVVLDLVERAEQLAAVMAARSLEFAVCHSDIHPGNLFVDAQGPLFIVDWDEPMLAPKERDLMFIGGGQGFMGHTAQTEERLFYRSYDPSKIDAIALAYYRYERIITDIAVACEQVFASQPGGQDRAQSLEYLKMSFWPDCAVDLAYRSDQTRRAG
jgi:spectinomycin phosphotransferase